MSALERSRGMARVLLMALAAAGPPCGAVAGQPEPVAAITSDGPAAAPVAVPPVPLQSFTKNVQPFALPGSEGRTPYEERWRDMAAAIARDAHSLARCRQEPDRCSPAARQLLAIIHDAQAKDGRARLGEINRAINLAIRFEPDTRQGAADAWASPLDTLSTGRGDCEDYAIAKYLALREAGLPPGNLRVVVVRDIRLRQDHAVLAARLDNRWLVLDNRTLLLLDDRDIPHYRALTAFGPEPGNVLLAAEGNESTPVLDSPAAARPGFDPS